MVKRQNHISITAKLAALAASAVAAGTAMASTAQAVPIKHAVTYVAWSGAACIDVRSAPIGNPRVVIQHTVCNSESAT
jgi:hypothetical protein